MAARSKALVCGFSLAGIVGVELCWGGCLSVLTVVCSQVEVSASDWLLVQRSPTDCGESLCVIKKPRECGGHGLPQETENCCYGTLLFRTANTSDFYLWSIWFQSGTRGGVVVKALRYKPAVRGFDSRWCHWNFSLTFFPVALWPWGRLSL